MAYFEAEVTSHSGWYTAEFGRPPAPIAYFSAEYAFHNSLPLYAGGLGVLAGDYIKECSDLAVPVVAVGLIYSRGYVSQKLRDDGWQEDQENVLDRTWDPVRPVLDREQSPLTVQVPLFDPPVHVLVWRADIGRVPVYLLDTDLRAISRGIGRSPIVSTLRNPSSGSGRKSSWESAGCACWRRLGFIPAGIHINEGHPGLALLQRVRMLVEKGKKFQEAVSQVRESSIFTTHTPLTAGTDVFPFPLFEKYFSQAYGDFGTDRDGLLQLGVYPSRPRRGLQYDGFCPAHDEILQRGQQKAWRSRPANVDEHLAG